MLNKNKNTCSLFIEEIVGIDAGAGIMKATEKAINEYGLEYKLMRSAARNWIAEHQELVNSWIPTK